MKKLNYLLNLSIWIAFAIMLATIIHVVFAAPMPLRILVNHKTHQCAQITPGDECGDVILPPDWEYLDASSGEKCPDDYTLVDLRLEWKQFKSQFCCSEGHSGSAGDCQDVVTQPNKRQCAFVEDIQQCPGLPEGWKAWGQGCPFDFYWTQDVVCSGSGSSLSLSATSALKTETAGLAQPTEPPPASQTKPTRSPDTRNPLFPCASSGLALLGLFLIITRRHKIT
jgi:hypothetical protein